MFSEKGQGFHARLTQRTYSQRYHTSLFYAPHPREWATRGSVKYPRGDDHRSVVHMASVTQIAVYLFRVDRRELHECRRLTAGGSERCHRRNLTQMYTVLTRRLGGGESNNTLLTV